MARLHRPRARLLLTLWLGLFLTALLLPGVPARASEPDWAVIVLTVLLLLSIVLLPRWRQRLAARRPRTLGFLGRVLLPISWDVLWPLVLLVLVPRGAGFPVLRIMAFFQPDLTYWALTMALVSLIKGVARIGLAATALRRQP
jgi:hypothetical protein